MTTEEKKDKPVTQADRLVFNGLKGALIVTVFLFTPLLSMLLNVTGMSSIAPLMNALMFPLLFICFGAMAYGMWQKKMKEIQDKHDSDD
ncbi:hypothetical protein MNBD_GAMMA17-1098 [hydrothermal vent metagenome]|uniref:Uncharacterized protein n=1 Tax=hydrothermal vent metagenome TaxID=652676 RepID=A0A3B0ZI60_9ZZZZ